MRDGSAFLFYTNYAVNLSGTLKYRRANLKGNYAVQLISYQGDGQALYYTSMGRFFNSIAIGYYYREGSMVGEGGQRTPSCL